MRLTSRQTKIIQLLSRNSDGLTGASMLHELDCSLRTLRSEISTINQNAGGKLILSSNKGYLLDTCRVAQDKFKKYLDYFRIAYRNDEE